MDKTCVICGKKRLKRYFYMQEIHKYKIIKTGNYCMDCVVFPRVKLDER